MQHEVHTGAPAQDVSALQQATGHLGTDRAEPDQADAE